MQRKPDSYRERKIDHAPLTRTDTTLEESQFTRPTQNPQITPKRSHRNTSGTERYSTKNPPRGCRATPYGITRSNSSRTHQQPYQGDSSHSRKKNTKRC